MKPDSHHHKTKRLLGRGWQVAGPCIRRYVLKNLQSGAEALGIGKTGDSEGGDPTRANRLRKSRSKPQALKRGHISTS